MNAEFGFVCIFLLSRTPRAHKRSTVGGGRSAGPPSLFKREERDAHIRRETRGKRAFFGGPLPPPRAGVCAGACVLWRGEGGRRGEHTHSLGGGLHKSDPRPSLLRPFIAHFDLWPCGRTRHVRLYFENSSRAAPVGRRQCPDCRGCLNVHGSTNGPLRTSALTGAAPSSGWPSPDAWLIPYAGAWLAEQRTSIPPPDDHARDDCDLWRRVSR
jgi:hypothetical protein